MKKNSELRAMSLDELKQELLSLLKEQFNLRLQKANQALAQLHLFKQVRRGIARIKTIMTEKMGDAHGK